MEVDLESDQRKDQWRKEVSILNDDRGGNWILKARLEIRVGETHPQ